MNVCTAGKFLSLACDGVSHTFDFDCRLSLSSGRLVGIKNSLAEFIDEVDICSFVHGSDFDTASSVFGWQMMRAIDWNKVMSDATNRGLLFEYRLGIVRGLLTIKKAHVMVDGRSKFVSLALVSDAPIFVSLLNGMKLDG